MEGVGKARDVAVYLLDECQQLCTVGKLKVFVVGEVELQLE